MPPRRHHPPMRIADEPVRVEVSRRRRFAAFLRGFGRVVDLFGISEPLPVLPTDAEALEADWRAVGDDLRRAMGLPPSAAVRRRP